MTRNRSRRSQLCQTFRSRIQSLFSSLNPFKPSTPHVYDVPDEFMSAHAAQEMTGSLYYAQPYHTGPPPSYRSQRKDRRWDFDAHRIRAPPVYAYQRPPSPSSSYTAVAPSSTAVSLSSTAVSRSSTAAVSRSSAAATYQSSTAPSYVVAPRPPAVLQRAPYPALPARTASTRAAHGHAAPSFPRSRPRRQDRPPSLPEPAYLRTASTRATLGHSAPSPPRPHWQQQDNIQTSGSGSQHVLLRAGAIRVPRAEHPTHAQFYTAWHGPQFSYIHHVPARRNDSVVVHPSRSRRH